MLENEVAERVKRRAVGPRQKTLGSSIGCTGIGLHSGAKAEIVLHPAAPDRGIVFRRRDVAAANAEIAANWRNVVDTRLATTLANEAGVSVATTEHLLAAIAGLGVDNVLIEVTGGEIPIMDGSAEPFVFLIECAGLVAQDAVRRAIKVVKPIAVADGSGALRLVPAAGFSIDFEIEFKSPAVERQAVSLDLVNGAFKSALARARTFGFEDEVAALRDAGLALGGSLDNAVVIGGDGVLNRDGLRFDDEFVRHKMLDCIGDLALAGAPIIGHVEARRSGHSLNNRLLRALFADDDAWHYTTLSGEGVPGEAWHHPARRATA